MPSRSSLKVFPDMDQHPPETRVDGNDRFNLMAQHAEATVRLWVRLDVGKQGILGRDVCEQLLSEFMS